MSYYSNSNTHGGFRNKETWLVTVWLGDEIRGALEDGLRVDAEALEQFASMLFEASDLDPSALLRRNDNNPAAGLIRDFIKDSICEIDWRQLAEHWGPKDCQRCSKPFAGSDVYQVGTKRWDGAGEYHIEQERVHWDCMDTKEQNNSDVWNLSALGAA